MPTQYPLSAAGGAAPIDPMRFRFRIPVIYPINVFHRALPATIMLVAAGVWNSIIVA